MKPSRNIPQAGDDSARGKLHKRPTRRCAEVRKGPIGGVRANPKM